MATKKISDLTELTSPAGTEELIVNAGGVSKKITQANLFKLGDNVKAKFGASDDLLIYHNGSNSYIDDAGTGGLNLRSDGLGIDFYDTTNSQYFTRMARAGAVSLYHNGSQKLSTTATGIDVTGTVNGLEINTTATSNLGLGTGAVDSITTGDYNVGVGDNALTANTTGLNNTAIGQDSLKSNIAGSYNVAIGLNSLYNNTANDNTALGYSCLASNTTGTANVAAGKAALENNTTGIDNTAVGYNALLSNTTGAYNTANGTSALYSNTTGNLNTATGYLALSSNTTGDSCTAIGQGALRSNTSGRFNVAIGDNAGYSNADGLGNTFIGRESGYYCTTGSGNVQLGSTTSANTYSPAFAISTHNDRVVMGSSYVTNAYVKVAWTITSDQRDKTDITNFTNGLDYVNQLRPVNYVWDERANYEDGIPDGTKKRDKVQLGFLAQEVQAIEDSLGITNDCVVDTEDPEMLRITETKLIPILVNAIKELSAKVEALENA